MISTETQQILAKNTGSQIASVRDLLTKDQQRQLQNDLKNIAETRQKAFEAAADIWIGA